jgi:iron complex outermembrane receptor protein
MKKNRFVLSKAVTFRKWDNTNYAVFNSLKKVVRIGTLSAAYLLFANPDVATAQDADTTVSRNYDLEAIDVTSEELPESYSDISRVVVSINQKEIEQAAVASVDELIEYASNIDIRQRGTNGMQSDISIRGGSFDQTLILLNGMNITDPQTGHHNLNLPIDLSSVQRIEILKGPGSWKFGPGAFSGAINIVTSPSEQSYIRAQAEYGQHNLNKEQISGGFNIKNTGHLISAQRSASDGYIDNTDFKNRSVYYHGNRTGKTSEFNIQAGATDRAFGANNFYTAAYPNQYEEIQTYFGAASFKVKSRNFQITPRAYFRRNNDRFLLFRDNPPAYSNFHTTNVWGGNLLVNYFHGTLGTTTIGIDARNEQIFSNNLGVETDDPIYSPVNDTILLDKYHNRTNYSVFAGHKRYFDKLMINAGINFTHNTDIEKKIFIYPGVDIAYQANKNLSLFASVNKTMRMPTFTDLYYTSPNNLGNPALLPEEAIGYDLGIKFNNHFLSSSLTGFITQGSNMIDWVRETTEDKWRTINYTELNTTGIELNATINFKTLIESQNILNNAKIAYTYIDQQQLESNLISNYALNYLKHRFDFNLSHHIWQNIKANWHVAYQDRNGQFEKFVDQSSVGMRDYEPFWTVDLKIGWQQYGWNIYAEAKNLFDTPYYDFGNIPQPGRWLKIGLAKTIKFTNE